jgi:hypothetical protein
MTPNLAMNLPAGGEQPEEARALVLAELARIVSESGGITTTLESGTLELRLATGEIFHLGTETVTRIA